MHRQYKSTSSPLAFALLFHERDRRCPGAARPSAPLPLKTVRIYEAGVGYFERSGRVGKDSSLALPVPVSHLDDALKTLVVLGTDGKTSVAGIEFASSISVELGHALAGLPEGAGGVVTHAQLLPQPAKAAPSSCARRKRRSAASSSTCSIPADDEPGPCVAVAEPNAKSPKARRSVPRCVQRKEMTLLLLTNEAEIRSSSCPTWSAQTHRCGARARASAQRSASSTQGAAGAA